MQTLPLPMKTALRTALCLTCSLLLVFAPFSAGYAAAPTSIKSSTTGGVNQILTNLQCNYSGTNGFLILTHAMDSNGTPIPVDPGIYNESTPVLIGSQSKMFTAEVVLQTVKGNQAVFTNGLDTRLKDVKASSALGSRWEAVLAALPDEAKNYTVRDLLSMGTDLPNYMAVPADSNGKNLMEQWANNYGHNLGITHQQMVELSAQYFPGSGGNFEHFYSNTNAIILAIMSEAVTGNEFRTLIGNLGLGVTLNDSGNTFNAQGKINGANVQITPAIAWASGAMSISMEDLLKALYNFTHDTTRQSSGNVISMNGFPITYELGLMKLSWKEMLGVFNLSELTEDITSTGHGGSIPGHSSFSGWLKANGVDMGLAVYTNTLTAIGEDGYYTSTPSEAFYIRAVQHLSRSGRADGTVTDDGSTVTVSQGSTGGFATQDTMSGDNVTFVNNSPRYVASLDLTSNPLMPAVVSLDPTYTYYGKSMTISDPTEIAISIDTGKTLTLNENTRIEGYTTRPFSGKNPFIMVDISNDSTTSIGGEIAAYGNLPIALRTDSNVTLRKNSHLYAKGFNATALAATTAGVIDVNSMNQSIGGQNRAGLLAEGSASTGIQASDSAIVNVTDGADVSAVTYAYSMNSQFQGRNPWVYATYGAKVQDTATININNASVTGYAYHPWDGKDIDNRKITNPAEMRGSIASGLLLNAGGTVNVGTGSVVQGTSYGAVFQGALTTGNPTKQSTLNLDGAVLGGGLDALTTYPTYILPSLQYQDAKASVTANNSNIYGNISLGSLDGSQSDITMKDSKLYMTTYNQNNALFSFNGDIDVDDSNTFILPSILKTKFWVWDNSVGTAQTFTPWFNSYTGAYRFAHSGDYTHAWITGFAKGGPNANRMFDSFSEMVVDKGFNSSTVEAMGRDANSMTGEAYATQGFVNLGIHRTIADTAQNLAFPLGGGRTEGMASATRLAYGMSPDKAFGQGNVFSSFAHEVDQDILQLRSRENKMNGAMQNGLLTQKMNRNAGHNSLLKAWNNQTPESFEASSLNADKTLNALANTSAAPFHFFGGYIYNNQDKNSQNGYYGYTAETNGMVFGASFNLSSNFDLALYGAWAESDTDYKSINADVDTDTYQFGLMGRYIAQVSEACDLRFTGNLSYGKTDNDMERKVAGQKIKGSFDQHIYSAELEAALDFRPEGIEDLRISPFVSAQYAYLDQDRVKESGITALHTGGGSIEQFSSNLGLAVAKDFSLSESLILTPALAASWKHEFGDIINNVSNNFIGYTSRFTSKSLKQKRDALQAGLSIDTLWIIENQTSLGAKVGYGVEAQENALDQNMFVGLELNF